MLQLATNSTYRTREFIDADLNDWKVAASYANRFNTHVSQKTRIHVDAKTDATPSEPSIKISAASGCKVLGSNLPQFIAAGDAVLISPFDPMQVQKFVYSGGEEFYELPQAYFHYTVWSSGGHELVGDIRGTREDDGSYLLIDPCVLRKPPPTVADLLGTVAPSAAALAGSRKDTDCIEGRFNIVHPKCSQMCRTFDPQRKGGRVRTHCGVCLNCGL